MTRGKGNANRRHYKITLVIFSVEVQLTLSKGNKKTATSRIPLRFFIFSNVGNRYSYLSQISLEQFATITLS